ncbi:hypothetical protein AB0M87_13065 [Streptomyces sp. NPDC051320]|uniref:hypothetical protein n=1 Tax=Streptomyces sp. NPDC051320 TaxID=3154644 RepID=UPI003436F773
MTATQRAVRLRVSALTPLVLREWGFAAPEGGKLDTGAQFYTNVWRPMADGCSPTVDRLGRLRRGRTARAVAGLEDLVPHGLRPSHKVWLDELRHPRIAA